MRRVLYGWCVAVMAVFTGCVRDPGPVEAEQPLASAKGVYILNEGNFGRGNSTLSYYDLQTGTLYDDVFFSVNGKMLGDVGNALFLHGGRCYIVVNNSNKIEVIDAMTNANTGTITIGTGRSPRQMAFLDDSTALVTNLYDGSVLVVHLRQLVTGTRIPVGPNPDGIAIAGGKAFVANSGLGTGRSISIIDIQTLAVTRTIELGDNPVAVAVTNDGMVYVLCAGFYGTGSIPDDATPAKIFVLDPVTITIVDSVAIPGHAYVMAVGEDGRAYVPASDSVLIVDTQTNRISGTFARGAFYAVGIEESSGDVYLSDAKNFTQPGDVLIFGSDGRLKTQFTAGVIPGSFAFKR
jgi:YVTN family beta-propeller protein